MNSEYIVDLNHSRILVLRIDIINNQRKTRKGIMQAADYWKN